MAAPFVRSAGRVLGSWDKGHLVQRMNRCQENTGLGTEGPFQALVRCACAHKCVHACVCIGGSVKKTALESVCGAGVGIHTHNATDQIQPTAWFVDNSLEHSPSQSVS